MKTARATFRLGSVVIAVALSSTAGAQDMAKVRQGCTDNGFMPGTEAHSKCMQWIVKILREGPRAREELGNQCWWAMAQRNGQVDAGAALVCVDDPMAHLRAKPGLNCSATRDVFGRLDGLNCK